jgi:hypothetical protein
LVGKYPFPTGFFLIALAKFNNPSWVNAQDGIQALGDVSKDDVVKVR